MPKVAADDVAVNLGVFHDSMSIAHVVAKIFSDSAAKLTEEDYIPVREYTKIAILKWKNQTIDIAPDISTVGPMKGASNTSPRSLENMFSIGSIWQTHCFI